MRLALGNRLTDFLGMARQHEDGTAHGHDAVLFLFRGMAAHDLAVLDQNAVIDDGIRLMLVRDEQGAMALARAARSYECDDIHGIFLLCPSLLSTLGLWLIKCLCIRVVHCEDGDLGRVPCRESVEIRPAGRP